MNKQPIAEKGGGGFWWVRVGCLGDIVLAQSAPEGPLPHQRAVGRRVLLRTSRGVEVGRITRAATEQSEKPLSSQRPHVRILRLTSANDDLLIQRIERHKADAVQACRESIRAAGWDTVLLDVDHLFDGGTLLLHFLGEPPTDSRHVLRNAISKYEGIMRTEEFAALLETGCGPGCGTAASSGCGGTCQGCSLKAQCAVDHPSTSLHQDD